MTVKLLFQKKELKRSKNNKIKEQKGTFNFCMKE